ncbi:MAG: phospholipase D family protein [Rhizobacter sp.]|nr:phospholipase D family protein [Rhizobacter sp.]
MRAWAAACLCALALAGCASLPAPAPRAPETAFDAPQTTLLGRMVAAAAPSPRLSGVRLLVSGHDAFGSLAELADHAERSLDLQYYLIRSDASSRALMRRVRAAADRGVRVRLLLDDLNTAGQDTALMRLTAHPNIEVRLYNPFPARLTTYGRVLASLTDLSRINRRMHNKMTVADGALAITGGRNIGDPYFVHSQAANFLDVDLLVAGPVVRELSAAFDGFWNSAAAYPVEDVAERAPPALPVEVEGNTPPPRRVPPPALPGTFTLPPTALTDELARHELRLDWAEAKVLADSPLKAETFTRDLVSLLREARHDVTVISPYFVPGPRGVAAARAMAARGVKLRVLTNSLATTDAPVVHVGYARYREALLALGVELHELRPRLGAPRQVASAFGSSHASLHAKVVVVDGRDALVGSMNMDPRSQRLNTELGIQVRSPAIAQQLDELVDEICAGSTWRLSLAGDGSLRWTSTGPDATVLADEPEAGFWRKLSLHLMAPLAPDEML